MISGGLYENARVSASVFDAGRAVRTAEKLWECARYMDSNAVLASADFLVTELREAGMSDAKIEFFPADGLTEYGGWLMPLFWEVNSARLEIAATVSSAESILADYRENPQSLAMYSPATPGNEWVEGGIVIAPDVPAAGSCLRGRFLLLAGACCSPELNEAAARAGALGILLTAPELPDGASKYLNYSVPFDSERQCVPCFSLSAAASSLLESELRENQDICLRAKVCANRKAGTFPMVTASLGSGKPEVYLCAHMDEIGAQDNASGVAVAIESLRVLAGISNELERGIRIFFSTEVRGIQAWINLHPEETFFSGLNLDMIGCRSLNGSSMMGLGYGFPGTAHIASEVLKSAVSIADNEVGGMKSAPRQCSVSDAVIGKYPPVGHVSLEQKQTEHYHSSADRPEILCHEAIQWSGTAAVAFLYLITHLGHSDAVAMATGIIRQASSAVEKAPDKGREMRHRVDAGLKSLNRLIKEAPLLGDWETPEDLYRAGVDRKSGLWPFVQEKLELDQAFAELRRKFISPEHNAITGDEDIWREADKLVPVSSFCGFLSFEDHIRLDQREALRAATGLAPGWACPEWAWSLVSRLRGKLPLSDIVCEMQLSGINIEIKQAVELVHYLVTTGKVYLRPVLDRQDIRQALEDIGIRRGSILCVHASLSQFGYIPGGAGALIDALLDAIGSEGTLCLPVHSLSTLGNPPYDAQRSPSKLGVVSEYFRRLPGVLRTSHPTHSVAALGSAAEYLIGDDDPGLAPLSRNGFWGRLYDADGDVLLLCPINSATIFHVGETWTGIPQPVLIAHVQVDNGERRDYVLPNAPWHSEHFDKTMAPRLIDQGKMRCFPMGDSEIYLASARSMADISVEENKRNPGLSLGDGGKCVCPYCRSLHGALSSP